MADGFGEIATTAPVGVCFPAVVLGGRTMSAANVSKKWIGLEAEKLFEKALKRDIHFVNDADAAGIAEARYGAAKGKHGLVILTTLGTGIGTAFLYNGILIPNTELGHMELGGKDAETRMSYAAKERKGLSWEAVGRSACRPSTRSSSSCSRRPCSSSAAACRRATRSSCRC